MAWEFWSTNPVPREAERFLGVDRAAPRAPIDTPMYCRDCPCGRCEAARRSAQAAALAERRGRA